ncbi:hypothetical protein A3E39_00825 [Candidatus Uhrbacteria bacterium RIFCSPHIGHO2_12_FULL_60_25]|uniref:Uncharacterized protein n=1 Tax=Candidatus Uhrbacteria bacterium RIFCSPHIGHO2_12_FULL_60_25 TaxID=1802399 RepID=A0A1F7UN09_9BACT|nr:MAG: hypothetical protein A3D73_02975 [Candidatus Uhrbacteria bacterium RIFCSPHIGHO2_02_FULL_60_44]OGL79649.1 MAG: hypothetical protein A3E39_00825 [Candidatus Uhrbacteria bacterium RIFCSPHIGHO2_12_FULL_60_25]
MNPLLTPQYWFTVSPVPFQPWAERFILVAFVACVLFGMIAWIIELKGRFSKPMKRAYERVASLLFWSGVAGLFLWGFSYERIPVLSMRFFYLFWLAWVLWGLWRVYTYVWVEIPAQERRNRERTEREKWLPRRK